MALSVLIVEDNPVQQRLYRLLCNRFAYACTIFDSAERALEYAAACTELPAIVLLDCRLHGQSGLPYVQKLKQLAAVRNMILPVVAVTANAFESDRIECLDAGVDDYLSKPFTLEQFGQTLQRWMPKQNRMTVA
jgi:CheY-like chemotaxis protein